MGDTIIRKPEEAKPIQEPSVKANIEPNTPIDDHVEVPYTENKAFLDDYFGLGVMWHDQDAKFYPEVQKIDNYIKFKIENGDIGDDRRAVSNLLKSMEKLNNLKGETRSVVKLEVLANYVEFLMKNEHLKSNLRRYAN